jgi:hypothetical protein
MDAAVLGVLLRRVLWQWVIGLQTSHISGNGLISTRTAFIVEHH